MEFELDKEIDSLLRRAARGGEAAFDGQNPQSFSADRNQKSLHLDADEISLFAENALPVKTRPRVTAHLADCDRCRKILSQVISLNSETESENVHAKEIVAGSVSIPWYKKLFVFPQIVYAMGALALMFSGIIAFMVLQNSRDSQNASIARMEEVQEKPQGGGRGMSSDDEGTTSTETYSMSNTTAANTAATSNGTMATPAAATNANAAYPMSKPVMPGTLANSNSSISLSDKQVSAEKEFKVETEAPAAAPREKMAESAKKEEFVKDAPAGAVPRKDDSRNEDETVKLSKSQMDNVQVTQMQNQARMTPDTQSPRGSGMPPPINRAQDRKRVEARDSDAAATVAGETKNKTAATAAAPRKALGTRTTSAGGKTFNFANGVWYDSAYNQQGTINVRRGTNDYKKLDAGLRSIAESVGGIVVVVWKDKAYRIQ